MARCPGDCTKVDKESLTWFKVDQKGLVSGDLSTGTWATDNLIGKHTHSLQHIPTLELRAYILTYIHQPTTTPGP